MGGMAFFSRAFRVSVLSLLIGISIPAIVQSQQSQAQQSLPQRVKPAVAAPAAPAPAVDTTPWLYQGSDIPQDAAWSFGTLPNGLRYAVRKNGVPPGQVSIRVRVDAGSLNERDDERGFAHMIEHLSFRGSEYVPDGEAKRVWQRFGASFGSDTNAQTTPTQTVYKLDLPAATEAGLDESLKILSGMIEKPTLTAAALNAERPVVLAEQREQPGPQVRIGDAIRGLFFAGQPLADRSPIGTVKTLEAATAEGVAGFHSRWYRPENTVVIISGDMDPALFGRLVVKHFADWKAAGTPAPTPDFGKPDPSKPVSAATVEPGIPPIVQMAVLRPWEYRDDTILFNQKRMVDTLAALLINRRLETRARAGGSFLQANVTLDDISRSANGTFVSIVPVGDAWEPALKDVRAVIADATTTLPTQAEIDREYADLDTALRTQVETARVEAGARQADDMVQALDIRETVASPEGSYMILTDAKKKGMFTPAAIQASTKRIFEGTATRAIINTRVADPGIAAKLATALKADVTGLAGTRRTQGAVDFSKLPALGAPATVVSREKVGDIGVEKVVFSNGVRLLLFANPSETGRVYVRARFGTGYNALPAKGNAPAWAGDLALVQGGIGTLDQGDLDQLSAGRRIGLDFGIESDAFALAAMTSPADVGDQLRLMAAKLTNPGWDPAPVARARAVAMAATAGQDASPDSVLQRDLEGLLHDGDARWATPTPKQIQALTPQAFRKLWEPILASGPIEVSVFGDVKADETIAMVARTFGAMPARKAASADGPPIRFPAHNTTPVVRTHKGPDNQAAAVIAWPTGGGIDGIKDSRRLDVLAQVFSDRLFERLRSEAGASYSPSVASQWPIGLDGGGRLIAVGQVAPEKVDFFYRMAREIAADLVARPLADDELKRIMRPMGQQILRASTGNQFWMGQLAGAAYDPRRVAATETIAQDFVSITPEQLQATAAKYLKPTTDWTMTVLPEKAKK